MWQGTFEALKQGRCLYLTYVFKGALWLPTGNRVCILFTRAFFHFEKTILASVLNFAPFSVLHNISTSSFLKMQ